MPTLGTATPVGVAVLHAAPWSPYDPVREGAGELEVFLCAAQLQRAHRVAGIVGVGGRHGTFVVGAERALRHLALSGVPVVKLARSGDPVADPDKLFLAIGSIDEAEAAAILQRCLERYGAPRAAASPDAPTVSELAAIRAHLQPFREALALAATARVAVR